MIEAFLHISIAQSLFAAIIILTKKPLNITDKILSVWLFFVTCLFLLRLGTFVFPEVIHASRVNGGIITMAFPPFLYLYTKYLLKDKKHYKVKDTLHFIPFLAFIPLIIIVSLRNPEYENLWEDATVFRIIFGIAFFAVFISYGYVTIRLVNRYYKIRDDYYSFHDEIVNVGWIRKLIIVFYSFYSIIVILGFIKIGIGFDIEIMSFVTASYTLFIYIVSFKGYKQRSLLGGTNNNRLQEKSYKKSGLKEEDANTYVNAIIACMTNEKPWLNDEVTIQDISIRTEIPKHHITQVLNEKLNKNFYTLVNEFRTEEAIRLFREEKYDKWTIESIAYEAGFNSKSSFNTFFKKYKGVTPSVFRKTIK